MSPNVPGDSLAPTITTDEGLSTAATRLAVMAAVYSGHPGT
jgi:hypothetical protein